MNYSVAFIGCGKVARFHADVLVRLGLRIQAVCGSSPSSVTAKAFAIDYAVPRVYDNYQELLAEDDADFLWVLTSWNVTESLLADLLRDGRPALVEKPVATTSLVLDRALQTFADQTAVTQYNLFCGMNRQHYDFIPFLKETLSASDVHAVSLTISEQTRIYDGDDPKEAARLRSLWVNSAIHEVDLLCHLIGDVEVIKIYRSMDARTGSITNVNAFLEAKQFDCPIFLTANWDSSEAKAITIETTDKTIKLSPIERMTVSAGMLRSWPTESDPVARYVPNVVTEIETSMEFKPGFYNQARFFSDLVETGRFWDYCRRNLIQARDTLLFIERLLGQ